MSRIPPATLRHRITVTRMRDTSTTDRYGDEVRQRSDAIEELRCLVVVGRGNESLDDRDLLRGRYVVLLDPDADIEGVDEGTWEGRRLRIDGPPRRIEGRRGPHHLEVDAVEVAG